MTKASVILNAINSGASDDELLVLENTDESEFNGDGKKKKKKKSSQSEDPILNDSSLDSTLEDEKEDKDIQKVELPEVVIEEKKLKEVKIQSKKGKPRINENLEIQPELLKGKAKNVVPFLRDIFNGTGLEINQDNIGQTMKLSFPGVDEKLIIPLKVNPLFGGEEERQKQANIINDYINHYVYDAYPEYDSYKAPVYRAKYLKESDINLEGETSYSLSISKYLTLDELNTKYEESEDFNSLITEIDLSLTDKKDEIFNQTITKYDLSTEDGINSAITELTNAYQTLIEDAVSINEEYINNIDANEKAVSSVYDKKIEGLYTNEQKDIVESDELSLVARHVPLWKGIEQTFKFTFPAAIKNTTAMYAAGNVIKLNNLVDKLDLLNKDLESKVTIGQGDNLTFALHGKVPFEERDPDRPYSAEYLNPFSITKGTYKVKDLLEKINKSKSYFSNKYRENIIESKKYQEILDSLGTPEFWTEDGFNWDFANWQEALGTQVAQMFSALLTGSMTTFVQEGGGKFSELMDFHAAKLKGLSVEKFYQLPLNEQLNALTTVIDSGAKDEDGTSIMEAAVTHGISASGLELASDIFIVLKGAKVLPKKYTMAYLRNAYKSYLASIRKDILGDAAKVSFVEWLTEMGQEVSGDIASVRAGKPVKLNAELGKRYLEVSTHVILTTPFIFGGGKATSTIYNRLSYNIAVGKDKEIALKWLSNTQNKVKEDFKNKKISAKVYEQRMDELDGLQVIVENSTLRYLEDPKSIEIALKNQILKTRNEEAAIKAKEKAEEEEKNSPEYNKLKNKEYNANRAAKKAEEEIDIQKAINHIKIESRKFAQKINSEDNGKTMLVFETISEFEDFFKQFDENFFTVKEKEAFFDGRKLGFTSADGTLALVCDELIINEIKKGGWAAENTYFHEGGHFIMFDKSKEELQQMKDVVMAAMMGSADPIMVSWIKIIMERQAYYVAEYLKEGVVLDLSSKLGIEEWFTALSDVMQRTKTETMSQEAYHALGKMTEALNELLGAELTEESALEFIKRFNLNGSRSGVKVKNEWWLDENGLPTNFLLFEVPIPGKKETETQSQDPKASLSTTSKTIYSPATERIVIESERKYPERQKTNFKNLPQKERNRIIAEENENIQREIIKAEDFVFDNSEGRYTLEEANKIQNSVRTEGVKKIKEKFITNNMGAILTVIDNVYDSNKGREGGIDRAMFEAAVFEEVSVILNNYKVRTRKKDADGNDMFDKEGEPILEFNNVNFNAYAFGKNSRYVINGRIVNLLTIKTPGIWERLIRKEMLIFEENVNDLFDTTVGDLDVESVLNIKNEIENYKEVSEIKKVLKITNDSELYQNVNEYVFDYMGEKIKLVDSESFSQDVRNKNRDTFWGDIKKIVGTPVKFKIWLQETNEEGITNAELLYNIIPLSVMSNSYNEFVTQVFDETTHPITGRIKSTAAKTSAEFKGDPDAGNLKWKKNEYTPEIEAAWIDRIAPPADQRPDMALEGLTKHLADIMAKDAIMQTIQSKAFKNKFGVSKSQILLVSMKLQRGLDMKFNLATKKGKTMKITTEGVLFGNQALQLESLVVRKGFGPDELDEVVSFVQSQKGFNEDVKGFIISMYDKDMLANLGGQRFKQALKKHLPNIDPALLESYLDDGVIRYNPDVLDDLFEDVSKIAKTLGPEVMAVIGYEIFAFHYRYLDAGKNKKGKNPFGVYAEKLIKLEKEVAKQTTTLPEGLILANVRLMNKGVAIKNGGIFKKIQKILDLEDLTQKEKLDMISAKHGAEILAANKANHELGVFISKTIAEAYANGDIKGESVLHIYQAQTNLTFGFRALTSLEFITVLNKSAQLAGDAKGEHLVDNATTMAKLALLTIRYGNNPIGIDLDAELRLIYADHAQWLTDKKLTKIVDDKGGKNNTGGRKRILLLDEKDIANVFSPDRLNAREAIIRQKSIDLATQDIAKAIEEKELIIRREKTKGKVIFLVGGAGSGKSNIIHQLGGDKDYIIINPDIEMEAELEKAGLSLDQSIYKAGSPERSQWATIQQRAIQNSKEAMREGMKNGIGMIVDGTAASEKVMEKNYNDFSENGYEIAAIHVETSVEVAQVRNSNRPRRLPDKIIKYNHIAVNERIKGYKHLFGDNFFVVNTDNLVQEEKLPNNIRKNYDNFTNETSEEKYSLSTEFNDIIENSTGVESKKVFSEAQSILRGARIVNRWDFLYPPSAYDLEMFIYRIIGKGTKGEQDFQWFKENLFDPYNAAYRKMQSESQRVQNEYRDLLSKFPEVKKGLKDIIPETNFTYEQAIRVSIWTDKGIDMQEMGLSKRDQKLLVDIVSNNIELTTFKDALKVISRDENGYVDPSNYWTTESIAYDLDHAVNAVGRAKHLTEWKNNIDEIFSIDNLRKLKAMYGPKYVAALKDMLYRMEYAKPKIKPGDIEAAWSTWVNNSVGAIMFLNMRSAVLQTISTINFIDTKDNTPFKAAKAFADIKQWSTDFCFIWNSPFLKERRGSSKQDINMAELSAYVKGKENRAKAVIAFLLEKGFTPTRIADSFAIAAGGSSFLRNTVNGLLKRINPKTGELYTMEEAAGRLIKDRNGKNPGEKGYIETRDYNGESWILFYDRAEKGQQSSRPDLISQQQAGGLGKLLLAFKNTPMQYNRFMIKAILDLKANRGETHVHLTKIAYYGLVQNVIFTSLQTALWAALGDEDEWDTKKERVANGMIDTILNGLGLTGTVAVTLKNGYLRYRKEKKKGFNADHTRTIIEFANLSPTIGSKLRKLYGGIRTEQLNKDAIDTMGWNVNNPAFNAIANVISATTNIPLDRAVTITQNLILASKDETEFYDSLALVLGWNPWDLGIEPVSRIKNIKAKEERKELEKKLKEIEKAQKLEKEGKDKQDKEKKEGKQVTCLKCKLPVVEGKKYCTVHEKVPQRENGEKTQCEFIKGAGSRTPIQCGSMTGNASGYCYYHDNMSDEEKKGQLDAKKEGYTNLNKANYIGQ